MAAKRYLIPIEETDQGQRTMLLHTTVKDIALDGAESVMLYFTPDQPVATLYVFHELSEIATWLERDRNNHIGYMEAAKPVDVVVEEVGAFPDEMPIPVTPSISKVEVDPHDA